MRRRALAVPQGDRGGAARRQERWAMTVFGQRLERREDADLLKGQGDYVANLAIPDCLAACFVLSPYARATFSSVEKVEKKIKKKKYMQ